MILSKKIVILTLSLFPILIGCEKKPLNSPCGEVSTRLLFSFVDIKLQNIEKQSQLSNHNTKSLLKVIEHLRNFNNQIVIQAGGFKEGKSLEIVEPCKAGEQIATFVKNNQLETSYNELVNQFLLNSLIDKDKAANMRFIISSYFCKEGCAFSESNITYVPIGLLLLDNLTLQFTLLELIEYKD